MGNCFSDNGSAMTAVGATAATTSAGASNQVVDLFLKSRGFLRLYSQIEVTQISSKFVLTFLFSLAF